MKPEQLEIARLRRELAKLKAERDILKNPRPASRRNRREVRLHREAPGDVHSWFETAQERLLTMRIYFAARFALIAEATRLTGARPISLLTSLVAATSFGMSTPVAIPMPSSM
jgi:hypothetical protein